MAIRQGSQPLTESLLHELDNILTDPNDTIISTVTLSQMDATYDEDADSDDSITLVKAVQKAQQKDNSESKTNKQIQRIYVPRQDVLKKYGII